MHRYPPIMIGARSIGTPLEITISRIQILSTWVGCSSIALVGKLFLLLLQVKDSTTQKTGQESISESTENQTDDGIDSSPVGVWIVQSKQQFLTSSRGQQPLCYTINSGGKATVTLNWTFAVLQGFSGGTGQVIFFTSVCLTSLKYACVLSMVCYCCRFLLRSRWVIV